MRKGATTDMMEENVVQPLLVSCVLPGGVLPRGCAAGLGRRDWLAVAASCCPLGLSCFLPVFCHPSLCFCSLLTHPTVPTTSHCLPAQVTTSALALATEAARLILKIDDIVPTR